MKRNRFKDPETEKEPDHKDIEAETHKKRQKDGKRDIERGTDMGGGTKESLRKRDRDGERATERKRAGRDSKR